MNYKIPYDLSSLCFSLGCLPLLFLAKLPTISISYILLSLLIITVMVSIFVRNLGLVILGILLASFLWSTNQASGYLHSIEKYIDQKLTVQGVIKSLNILDSKIGDEQQGYYVNVDIEQIDHNSLDARVTISLFWQKAPFPSAGETWQVNIKTKATHSYLNQGSFDTQRFAMANRRILIGTIDNPLQLDNDKSLRQQLANRVLPYINLFEHGDMMLALALGERARLTPQHKTVMLQTGIAHLMAISGMHIVLVAYLGTKLARCLQFFLPIRFIYYWMPLLVGFCCALFYAWLSGFNPPVMRAILALFLWQLFSLRKILLSSWQMINRIIAILLFIDPLMILSESFWLSCYAVICLIFIAHWFPSSKTVGYKRSYLFQLIKLQCLLTLLLLPIQLLIFNGTSSVAIIANLLAIPIISLITFPAVLAMVVSSFFDCFYLAIGFGIIAEQSVSGLFTLLTQFSNHWLAVDNEFYLLSGLGWVGLIVWQTGLWRRYWISILCITSIMLSPLLKQHSEHWQVDMLDVGHGLAIVISKGRSAILYDTGAKWQNSSAAERIIIPFLQWHNLTVEGIIISHEHNDHIGGLATIQQYFPNAWLMSPSNNLSNDYSCRKGSELHWQNLQLSVLWPDEIKQAAFNAESCVVRISDGRYSILLTGDLEKKQEELLVLGIHQSLFSTVLQIPHHASNTSSSYAFLSKVNPTISLGSVSRYNPWKLPSNKALFRYKDLNLRYSLTAISGQISIIFYSDNWIVKTMRGEIKPRWYHDWFGALPIYG